MILALLLSAAHAESWCAIPLVAHEWGVVVLHPDGTPADVPDNPSWFGHRAEPVVGQVVRSLPADSGERALPVLQFYGSMSWGEPIPVGVEVGFTHGEAQQWWPPVDRLVPAKEARSPAAAAARSKLLADRAVRSAFGPAAPASVVPDPTRQLVWDRLDLVTKPHHELPPAEVPWVTTLRDVPNALYVEHGAVSERFVFYDAGVSEQPAIVIRGDRAGLALLNTTDHPVHDVVYLDGQQGLRIDVIPAQGRYPLKTAKIDRDELRTWLAGRWLSTEVAAANRGGFGGECVMMRDPAVPVEKASGHQLYGPEVDALLSVWSDRLLSSASPRIVYREDVAAVDAAMPLSIYTDMYHDVELKRLSVVLVEGVAIP